MRGLCIEPARLVCVVPCDTATTAVATLATRAHATALLPRGGSLAQRLVAPRTVLVGHQSVLCHAPHGIVLRGVSSQPAFRRHRIVRKLVGRHNDRRRCRKDRRDRRPDRNAAAAPE